MRRHKELDVIITVTATPEGWEVKGTCEHPQTLVQQTSKICYNHPAYTCMEKETFLQTEKYKELETYIREVLYDRCYALTWRFLHNL